MARFDWIDTVRRWEMEVMVQYMPPPPLRILEIGGGTGMQALLLTEAGYEVVSIDLPDSQYRTGRVFAVMDYDGRGIPFADGTFDLVFSSNVLEHVADLEQMEREILRVLRPGGRCLHAMPSSVWRAWSIAEYYLVLPAEILRCVARRCRRGNAGEAGAGCPVARPTLPRRVWNVLVCPTHGARGSALSELGLFSRRWWTAHFESSGFEVHAAKPMGLFYTGEMLLRGRWSHASRTAWARWLGSAAVLYDVRPKAIPTPQDPP